MQHNTAFIIVNVSKHVPEWGMLAEGSLFILEPEKCVSPWYRASFADNDSEKRVFHLVEKKPRKTEQNKLFNSPFLLCPMKDGSSVVSGGPSCLLAALTLDGPLSA